MLKRVCAWVKMREHMGAVCLCVRAQLKMCEHVGAVYVCACVCTRLNTRDRVWLEPGLQVHQLSQQC